MRTLAKKLPSARSGISRSLSEGVGLRVPHWVGGGCLDFFPLTEIEAAMRRTSSKVSSAAVTLG